jgi:hypothetical protein
MNPEIVLPANPCSPVKTAWLPCQFPDRLSWRYHRSNRTNKTAQYTEPAHYTENELIIPESIVSQAALGLQNKFPLARSEQGKSGNFAFILAVNSDQVNIAVQEFNP